MRCLDAAHLLCFALGAHGDEWLFSNLNLSETQPDGLELLTQDATWHLAQWSCDRWRVRVMHREASSTSLAKICLMSVRPLKT